MQKCPSDDSATIEPVLYFRFGSTLGPSHTRRRSVGLRAALQQLCRILLLRPVCGVCAAQQLVLVFVASRQKHAARRIELMVFFDT